MAIVVSDTSAIRALHHLSQLSLIRKLYGELIIPPAVDEELRRSRTRFSSIDLVALGEARIESPTAEQLTKVLAMQLDRGETEAIALAMYLNSSYLLIDERQGRLAARRFGIRITGVVGVLIEAKRRALIPAVAPLLARLRNELDFHISPQFEGETLKNIGETPTQ